MKNETVQEKYLRKAREAEAARNRRIVESVKFFLDDRSRMQNPQNKGGEFAIGLLAESIANISDGDTKDRRELAARILRDWQEPAYGTVSEDTRREITRIRQKAKWYLTVVDEYPKRLACLRDKIANLSVKDIGPIPAKEYARILWFEIDRTVQPEGWADHFAATIVEMERQIQERLDRDAARRERDRAAFEASHQVEA